MTADTRGRDTLTAEHWNGRVDIVVVNPRRATRTGFSATVQEISASLFGRMLSHQEWAGIVGAPDGSELTLLPARLDYGEEVAIEVRHPWIEQFALRRAVRVLSQLVIRNEGLLLRSQFQRRGIGARMLAVQVAAAERLGVARLETEADGRPGSPSRSGYYAWARLGFNGAISHAVKATLPEALRSAADINDLIRMPGGPAWWRQHGHAFEAVFDPKPGSPSLSILAAYTEEKGIQI